MALQIRLHATITPSDCLQHTNLMPDKDQQRMAPALMRIASGQPNRQHPLHGQRQRKSGRRNETLNAAIDKTPDFGVAFDEHQHRIRAHSEGGKAARSMTVDGLKDPSVHDVFVNLRWLVLKKIQNILRVFFVVNLI